MSRLLVTIRENISEQTTQFSMYYCNYRQFSFPSQNLARRLRIRYRCQTK